MGNIGSTGGIFGGSATANAPSFGSLAQQQQQKHQQQQQNFGNFCENYF